MHIYFTSSTDLFVLRLYACSILRDRVVANGYFCTLRQYNPAERAAFIGGEPLSHEYDKRVQWNLAKGVPPIEVDLFCFLFVESCFDDKR